MPEEKQQELYSVNDRPGMMFVNKQCPVSDVKEEAMTSSDIETRLIFTFEGPPVSKGQLFPPTAPKTLPDIMNLQTKVSPK